jgi:uncharacterized cupredoxin-like copper-binding protein
MKSRIRASALILALSSSIAFAHGDQSHEKKVFDPAKVEQTDFGKAGDPKKVTRTIKFEMNDNMRFTPDSITVKQGQTIKFVVTNHGKTMHEMVIGTMKELKEHAELMKKFPDMEHSAPHMAHVKPGKTEEIVWTFNQPGEFKFACLIAGHMEAGMMGTVKVIRS